MASAEGMVNSLFDRSSRFYSICLKNIKFYMNLLGHNFVVSRPKENSKWKNVFGGSFSSDNTLENDYEQFDTKLIVNLNEMKDVWNRNQGQLESYSEDANILYAYVLSTIAETLDM